MSNWGVTTLRILDALEHVGPMTRAELARELGMPSNRIGSVITRLCQPVKRPAGPRRVRISGWRDEEEGSRCYLRAIYALGSGPDAVKPPAKNHTERARRYRAGKRARESFRMPF